MGAGSLCGVAGFVVGARPEPAVGAPPLLLERSAAATTGRIQTVDAARAVALLGVVVIHSVESARLAPLGAVGLFSVPFYAFLAMYFQAAAFRREPGRPLHTHVLARLRRLYVPFLAWSVVYLIVRDVKHLVLSGQPAVRPEPYQLWVGTAHHLWFLPFLTVVTVLTSVVGAACARWAAVRWAVVVLGTVGGAALAVVPRPDWLNYVHGGEGYLFLQGWRALPAVVLGVALAWGLAGRQPGEGNRAAGKPRVATFGPWVGWAGAVVTAVALAYLMTFGYSRAARTLGGLGWMAFALARWRGPMLAALAWAGRFSYGAYLAHVLVIEGVQAVAHRAGLGASPGLDVFTIVAGAVGGFGIAVGLSRSRWVAWMNG
jgi:peptidoglycan/LPS O-acetylase OafA/YrhL